jgi:hypothetical protein
VPPNLHDCFHVIYALAGTAVDVMGSNNRVNTSNGWDPSWECFIDNVSIGATDPFPYFENNWLLCHKPDLNDGPHQLTVNVTSNTGQMFWFDYIQYTPSATLSLGTAFIRFDHLDPAIVYGPGWGPLGDTANMTTALGTEAKFNFTGALCLCTSVFLTKLPMNHRDWPQLDWLYTN